MSGSNNIATVDLRSTGPATNHPGGTCRVGGEFAVAPSTAPDTPLWLYRLLLQTGTRLTWTAHHGDEVLLLTAGMVELAGESTCEAGGAVIIESGVPCEIVARQPCEILHYGCIGPSQPGPLGPPEAAGHSAYIVTQDERPHVSLNYDDGVRGGLRYWADSTRPTNRVGLFEVTANGAHRTPSHSHSQDEIIYVTDGELRVGPTVAERGMSIFIPAHRRYGFTSPGPHSFINYRRDATLTMFKPGESGQLQTVATMKDSKWHQSSGA